MTRLAKALLLGFCTAIIGVMASSSTALLDLEETAGLDWLFMRRGPIIPPDDIVIISIDKTSADALGLPADPARWPRHYHAELLGLLTQAGAAVIVLDIFFKEPRDPQTDAQLAQAIQAAGNVVLFEYTRKDITRLYDSAGVYNGELIAQRLIPPVEPIASAALARAPFPLPVFPVKVSQFWLFTPGTGDLPTEPVIALQLYAAAHYPELLQLIQQAAPDITLPTVRSAGGLFDKHVAQESVQTLRTLFTSNASLASTANAALHTNTLYSDNPEKQALLRALITMYSSADSHYLNFYGPPQTITTLPYVQILHPERQFPGTRPAIDLHGKTVFIGYSERLQPEQLDEFLTVYSQNNGLHLSGVEIAATAFANLLENNPVMPLPMPLQYLLLAAWGMLLGACMRLLPVFPAVATGIVLAGLYLLLSQLLFNHSSTWLPLIVPLFMQAPFALFAAILWHYLEVHRERESIRSAFGLYLPAPVVDELASELANGKSEGKLVYGTCLSTDADKYTTLSESMKPEALAELMNAYYETLFQPVRQHGGIISDVVGDAMLAIWASGKPERELRYRAILAALAISEVVRQPRADSLAHLLPTRIGLHSGQILLGSIGAVDHYEYRAVGDIVNTSTRIQGMNAVLGTRLLLTQQVLEGIDDFVTRDIGSFVMAGKTRPLVIHEVIGQRNHDIDASVIEQQQLFAEALNAFRQGDWTLAHRLFTHFYTNNPTDGVSRYYLNFCQRHHPDDNWNGAIRLMSK